MSEAIPIGFVDTLALLAGKDWDKSSCNELLASLVDYLNLSDSKDELTERFNRLLTPNLDSTRDDKDPYKTDSTCERLPFEQRVDVAILFYRLLRLKEQHLPIEKLLSAWRVLKLNEQDAANLFLFLNYEMNSAETTQKVWDILSQSSNTSNSCFIILSGQPSPYAEQLGNGWEYFGDFSGEFLLLYFPDVGCYLTRYIGSDKMIIDEEVVNPALSYCFKPGNIITTENGKSLRFDDVTGIRLKKWGIPGVTLTVDSLSFAFPNGNQGIKPFSTVEYSGRMVGILGGSGVGKSTLLNLLSGKLKPHQGRVILNGYDVHNEPHSLMGVIGFVPQDDLLFDNLTVYQNMLFNAKLCFGNYNRKQINELVENTLKNLDLWEIRNLRVGNPLDKVISGGQRKRLNIGLELLREPAVLFLDEPTSGLSSNDSMMVMGLLRKLTENGKLIIVNIHQPSERLFKLFDRLWVLDRGGYPVYVGYPTDAIDYFRKYSPEHETGTKTIKKRANPEDILDIIEQREIDKQGFTAQSRRVAPEEWYRVYKETIESQQTISNGHKTPLPPSKFRLPDVIKQLGVFSKRNLLSKLSNKQYVLLNILEPIVLGVILSFFIKNSSGVEYLFGANRNIPAFIFMSVIVSLFLGLSVSAEEIIGDRKILERESFLNLSRFSYINSKVLYLFGLSAIQMLLFVSVSTAIIGIKGLALKYWLVLFSSACFANVLGLAISAMMKSVVSIYITIPLLLVPQILLSGTVVEFDNLNSSLTRKVYVPVIGDLMASRWAYEALAVTQFMDNPYEKHFFDSEMRLSQAAFRSSYLIPRLQTKLEECLRLYNLQEEDNAADISRHLRFIANEIEHLTQQEVVPRFELIVELKQGVLYEKLADELAGYLIYIRKLFQDEHKRASAMRDSIYLSLKSELGEDGVYQLKQRNHNTALAEWVLRSNEVTKYLETNDRLIQKTEPIFLLPGHRWGRAQLYAPYKFFNGQYVKTIWFNVIAMWLFTLLVYTALHLFIMNKKPGAGLPGVLLKLKRVTPWKLYFRAP